MVPEASVRAVRRLAGEAHRRGWLDEAAWWSITGHLHAGRVFEGYDELRRRVGRERLGEIEADATLAPGLAAAISGSEFDRAAAHAPTTITPAAPSTPPPPVAAFAETPIAPPQATAAGGAASPPALAATPMAPPGATGARITATGGAQLPVVADFLAQLTASLLSAPPPRLTQLDPPAAQESEEPVVAGPPEEPPQADRRYRIARQLGQGGTGRVYAAEDRNSGRLAALKVLNQRAKESPELVRRFINEARITAQLEHPGIVPVYDVGMLPSGEPFYTMRVVGRHSLADILWDPLIRHDYPLVRLLTIFDQVCCSLGYAHSRGVVHRDVKPENVLVGNFGEVYLTDWGIARVLPLVGAPGDDAPADDAEGSGALTAASSFLGTPGYMPPEQIVDPARVDARADIFAAGVILYEILTGRSPFRGKSAVETLRLTLSQDALPPAEVNPHAPLLLGELALRCLQRDPEQRPQSMAVVVEELQAYLEGSKERARQREAAAELVRRAAAVTTTCLALREERDRLLGEAARALDAVRPHDDVGRKAPAWEGRDRAAQAERESEEAFAEATVLFSQALARDPENLAARRSLAELYWMRMIEAEGRRNEGERAFFERLMRQHDDGTHAARLRAKAKLVVAATPDGAEVAVARLSNLRGILTAGHARPVGRTPLTHELPAGDLLVTVTHPDHVPLALHLDLRRGEEHRAEVRLRTPAEVGEGFVLVPAGPVQLGGDPDAPGSLSARTVAPGDFAIARLPVTYGEYFEFLDDLERTDPAAARRHAPRDAGGAPRGVACRDGRWVVLPALLGRQHADDPATDELQELLRRVPVTFVDWFDAVAYCRWRSARDGHEVRLPCEHEWEKAARGADGRPYPWGDFFDATFCKMRDSRPGAPAPEPVGAFERDCSPYGVRDLAGGVREWVADIVGERSAAELAAGDGAAAAEDETRVVRGGCWLAVGAECRAAARTRAVARVHRGDVGFRVVRSL
jgi:serine/threonine-protein kinase